MKQHLVRAGALLGVATLTALTMAPAAAAPIASRASANALTLSVAGNPFDSGIVRATNDGTGEIKTGVVNPPISVLLNQNVLDIGALAQDAEATIVNRNGNSQACSGIAGDGASVANVGESNCITPGQPVGVNIANLDLTGAVLIDPESALAPFGALQPIIDQLVAPLTQAISQGLAPLGATGLQGTLGAVQARCDATPGNANGTANIVDSSLSLDIAGNTTEILNFPANPPPNLKVVTDLDQALGVLIDALRVDLNTTFDAQLAPLQLIIDPIQQQLVDTLIKDISDQLQPLEDNLLDITLNKQTRSPGAIEVTALDLRLLPAASQFGQPDLIDLQIANVTCGANGRVNPDNPNNPNPGGDRDCSDFATQAAAQQFFLAQGGPENDPNGLDADGDGIACEGPSGPDNPDLPDVPTTVNAGAVGGDQGSMTDEALLIAGLLMLAGAAGLVGYRRMGRV